MQIFVCNAEFESWKKWRWNKSESLSFKSSSYFQGYTWQLRTKLAELISKRQTSGSFTSKNFRNDFPWILITPYLIGARLFNVWKKIWITFEMQPQRWICTSFQKTFDFTSSCDIKKNRILLIYVHFDAHILCSD